MTHSTRGLARLGLLVPYTNTNMEPDFAMMCPAGVSLHVARMGGYDEHEIPDEAQMQGLGSADLEEPLALLSGAKPDVVIYGCTSATLTHGQAFDRDLADRISRNIGAKTVTAAGALVVALRRLGVSRIGFASPYVPAINEAAIDFLSSAGVQTVARSEVSSPLSNDGQGALTPEEVFALGRAADHDEADALVLSCTDMRSLETLQVLENAVGKPVICSNQAMMSEALSVLGHSDPIRGFGQLLVEPR